MTQDPPELFAKKRNPVELQEPRAIAASAAMIALYGILAVCLVGLALYMLFVEKRPPGQPHVFVPLLGAGWFALRATMLFSAQNKKAGG